MDLSILEPWSVFLVAFAAVLFCMLFLKHLLWSRLLAWSSRRENSWGKSLLERLNLPAKFVVFGLTLAFANHFSPETFKQQAFVALGMRVFFILVVIWILDRLAVATLRAHPHFRALAPGTMQLILVVIRILVCCLGLLIVLDNLGISITPILASLGVGSVAVALALQDTLNNFFSGVYVLADQPIRIGDFIRLEDGTEGTVIHIGWRSTKIRLSANNYLVVPNTKIASAQLTNYNMPSEITSFSVDGRVGYEQDPKRIEEITLRVARAIQQECPQAVPGFEPAVRFNALGDSGLLFTVSLQARRYPDSGTVRHEFIKRLLDTYKKENIEIPYPHRVVFKTGRDSSPPV